MEYEALVSNDVTPKEAKRRVLAAVALRFRCTYLDRCGLGWPLAPPPASVAGKERFASWDATAAMVRDGDTLYIAGLTGNQMITGFHYSLLRRHRRTSKPTGLTIVCHGGNGGRGKMPGNVDDLLRVPGLVRRFVTAHIDSHVYAKKRMLDPLDPLEVHILPLGVMSLIYDKMADGVTTFTTSTGASTEYDPRVGRGTCLTPNLPAPPQMVDVCTDGKLTYSLPAPTVTMLNAAAADADGNIYSRGMPTISDAVEIARAVKRNGGRVLVVVGLLVPPATTEWGPVLLSRQLVDAIVVDPWAEQCIGSTYADPYPFVTLESTTTIAEGRAVIDAVNGMLKLTPSRGPADRMLARLAAAIFCKHAPLGARLNIGTGLPEEVGSVLGQLSHLFEPFNEGGALGGISAPGTFFGAAVNPKEIVSSAEVYKRLYSRLDCVVLGGLEVDSKGNVNVAAKADPAAYVGPGGFVDLSNIASLVIFCVAFEARAKLSVGEGRVAVKEHGKPKFLPSVQEISFSGQAALAAGKRVFYVTHLGAFQLTRAGLVLTHVFPGVDITADVLQPSRCDITLPVGGLEGVEVVPDLIASGRDNAELLKLLEADLRTAPPPAPPIGKL